MSDDRMPVRSIFHGRTDATEIGHGAEIKFRSGAPISPFQDGSMIDVEFPDTTRATLYAEPDRGPTHVGWRHRNDGYWIFPLMQIEPGRWRVEFEEQHRWLDDKAAERGR